MYWQREGVPVESSPPLLCVASARQDPAIFARQFKLKEKQGAGPIWTGEARGTATILAPSVLKPSLTLTTSCRRRDVRCTSGPPQQISRQKLWKLARTTLSIPKVSTVRLKI